MAGRAIVALALCVATGCVQAPAQLPLEDEALEADPRGCELPLGGPEWDDPNLPEAEPGFEEELGATSLVGLPSVLDVSGLNALNLALVAYALDRNQEELVDGLETSSVDATRPLARSVLAAFARRDGEGLDAMFLRRGLHRYYACDRDLPLTLDAFVERYGAWSETPVNEIEDSVPKQGPRGFFAHDDPDVHVAVSATPNGEEVEVVLEGHRADGALEFLAYDEEGYLVDRAPLAMTSELSVLPAPFTCALCHRDVFANSFSVVDP